MSTNDTTPTTVKLSCGHAGISAPADVEVGAKLSCPKCKPLAGGGLSVRRVKAITETVVMSDDGGYEAVRPSEQAMADVTADEVAVDLMAAVDDAIAALPAADAPKAETKRGPRVVAASREARELKAWTDGGETGPRPATPNLDAIEAESGQQATRAARPADVDPVNPMALGLAQGPTGMVDSSAMTPDDPKPARRTRERKADTATGSRVTDLNLSAPRRAVMLEALPAAPDGSGEDVASVVALRARVAAGEDRVDVDAAGVRALLTGLAPLCTAGNKPACRLNDWLSKYADEVGYKPTDA